MNRSELAIVGAGPAGAWAAYRLARAGMSVSLFDGSHPREKPCGGGVTRRALRLVSDVIDPRSLPSVDIKAAVFEHEDLRVRVPLPVDDGQTLVVSSREAFDRALLDAADRAGARLVPTRVTDLSVTARGVTVHTGAARYRADRVLAGDGANSLVRRRVAAPFQRAQLSIATGYRLEGVTARDIVIRFGVGTDGYLWSFPRRDHLAVGVCGQADRSTVGHLRDLVRRWVRQAGIGQGARLVPYAWPIPSLSAQEIDAEQPAGDRWALLGDAAGLVDPITREGIYFALCSADAVAAALQSYPGREAQAYRGMLQDEAYAELRRAARLKAGFFRARFTRLFVEAIAASPAIAAVLADLVAGEQSYRGLRRRLLATFELGTAWRLLRTEIGERSS